MLCQLLGGLCRFELQMHVIPSAARDLGVKPRRFTTRSLAALGMTGFESFELGCDHAHPHVAS
jgi:hypothetical protein